jgi:hypothetical protein
MAESAEDTRMTVTVRVSDDIKEVVVLFVVESSTRRPIKGWLFDLTRTADIAELFVRKICRFSIEEVAS